MVSASPIASLPPGPAGVLSGPGTTGIFLALPGYSGNPFLFAAAASPPVLAAGTPRLGLVALIQPGLAPGRCLHLLGQLLGAAGRDKRLLTADRDPHAFQRIKQDAPRGEPGPERTRVVSRTGLVVWHGIPLIAERQPVPSA